MKKDRTEGRIGVVTQRRKESIRRDTERSDLSGDGGTDIPVCDFGLEAARSCERERVVRR